ncbi:transmembrane amino acid transporter protein-domain-containing protein [Amylocystis lapponica]|nr:transmembrane amino acid transporter protein-domain-containing protein [Amylocystis lapponica]
MSSLPAALDFAPQSLSSVRDVIESYRRTQAYMADYVSVSASASSQNAHVQEEAGLDAEFDTDDMLRAESQDSDDPVMSNLQWDEDLVPGSSQDHVARPFEPGPSATIIPHRTYSTETSSQVTPKSGERTPLLRQTTSLSGLGRAGRSPAAAGRNKISYVPRKQSRVSVRSSATIDGRHATAQHVSGHSTFGQTMFNAIATLLGIGMLSEPLAFAYAGWIGGAILITFYGLLTCYTAKLLARIILSDPHLKTYSDIGRKAFGRSSGPLISTLFCIDLFAVTVALVTLFADSLYASTSLIPTVLMPLSVLSYASIIGILSTFLIIAVILFDGFSKFDSPGSLWTPADTTVGVRDLGELGVAFGLFMASFGGHAVIPSLVRDMDDPSQFDSMINCSFAVATAIYAIIGVAGYAMFGNSVSDEFSQDLMKYSVYPGLNKIALWGLVLSPLSKFALAARPLNLTLEIALGIDTSTHGPKPVAGADNPAHVALKRALTAVERIVIAVLSVVVSILVPEFSAMMAFLGACTSFVICVIGPLAAKVAIAGRCGVGDAFLLASSVVMAVWGTFEAVWSA